MHPNPVFRQAPSQESLAFTRAEGFGTLAVAVEGEVLLSHIPFVVAEDGASARLHLVRSNPIARAGQALRPAAHSTPETGAQAAGGPAGLSAKIAVLGPQGYVSPDWYGAADQVPTWNYVAVHLEGRLVPLAPDQIRSVVDEMSAFFETQVPGKTPWTTDKMSPRTLEKLLIQIVPFRFDITAVQGTWKLGQNKTETARKGAAQALAGSGIGRETEALAKLMQSLP